ncbi:MAG: carbon-nitrogen hydrolase family protein [Mongoliibacter sp.]|uniref:carbon-nitrogen hydrolase family protein n=1 Tax=Mongoliibacter sp. TaxID=2022438 RepID=UPI0012F06E30|nr:carbon-nitrogen hydrolase family protein [Mongoliibacter sp.]TVP45574.1 MAG: carbon-nitrogen hydrolase family protein [Mongoliibacter sp.]
MNKITLACVQATPIIMDKDKTLEKVLAWMEMASDKGVDLILFPESFIPAYPAGMDFGTVVGSRTAEGRRQFQQYWENSVEVPGKETALLAETANKYGMFLAIGVTERDLITKTLYCTLLYFSPEGKLLGKHRKLKPTAAERIIWGEGDGSTLVSFDTEFGRVGGLICWENYMPLARMAMYGQGVEIYLAPTADSRDTWQASMVHIALEGRCFVIACNQYFTKSDYPEDLRDKLAKDRPEILSQGGSVIVSPLGKILAGPLFDEEGLLVAEVDLGDLIQARMDFDPAGHYNRPDVFNFKVNKGADDQ